MVDIFSYLCKLLQDNNCKHVGRDEIIEVASIVGGTETYVGCSVGEERKNMLID